IEEEIRGHSDMLPSLTVAESTAVKPLWHTRPRPTFGQVTVASATPVETTATPEPEPVASIAPAEPVVAEPAAEIKTAAPASVVPPPVPEVPEPAPTPVTTSATGLRERINEIKHDVNSRVGNPVNLIQADENIGREYMSALLAAMKSV